MAVSLCPVVTRRCFALCIVVLASYTFFCVVMVLSFESHHQLLSRAFKLDQQQRNVDFISSTKCHVSIELALVAVGSEQPKEAVALLKSLLFYRSRPLRLHLLCDERACTIFSTLFHTWQLPLFEIMLYRLPDSTYKFPDIFYSLPNFLPRNVSRVIAADIGMRFLDDISQLWTGVEKLSPEKPISLVKVKRISKGENKVEPLYSLMLLHLDALRNSTRAPKTDNDWKWLQDDVVELDCTWNLQPQSSSSFYRCKSYTQKAVLYRPGVAAGYMEPIKEKLTHIINTDGDVYRTGSLVCAYVNPYDVIPQKVLANRCAEFYMSSHMRRRTHLYYVTTPQTAPSPNDVTVMTMFTLDRFDALRKMLVNWEGPLVGVAYLQEHEVQLLQKMIDRHAVLKHRVNFALHIVYKRHRINAINYLRNVALQHTHTEYAIFLDVDLVPSLDLHAYLTRHLQENQSHKACFVIPTFEALSSQFAFPKDKPAMLKLMSEGKVIPYGENRWNKGHRATNYNRWKIATAPYKAVYEYPFEPYLVMRMREMPRYVEYVLDRMQDKAIFTEELDKKGYSLMVLPETFVIHMPHPTSESNYFYRHEKTYAHCKSQILKEFRKGYNPFLVAMRTPHKVPLEVTPERLTGDKPARLIASTSNVDSNKLMAVSDVTESHKRSRRKSRSSKYRKRPRKEE